MIRCAEGEVESLSPIVLAAGIGVSVTTAMAALPTVLLAFMDAQRGGIGDPSLVRALGDLNTIFFSVTSIMTGVFLAALGWAMLRSQLGMRWLGWVMLVVAAFNAIAVWIGVTFSSYHGHAWLIVGWGAYVGFLVVMLILSVTMLRRPHRPAVPAAISTPAPTLLGHHPVADTAPRAADRSSVWQPPPEVRRRPVPAGNRRSAGRRLGLGRHGRSAGTTATMPARANWPKASDSTNG